MRLADVCGELKQVEFDQALVEDQCKQVAVLARQRNQSVQVCR